MSVEANIEVCRRIETEFREELDDEMFRAMLDAVDMVLEKWVVNLDQPEGKHPQVRTGRYIGSAQSEAFREGGDVYGRVGTNLNDPPYPYFLEFGTSMMPAYPSLTPALEACRERVVERFEEALDRVISS